MTRTDRILDLMIVADSTGAGVREAIAATNPGSASAHRDRSSETRRTAPAGREEIQWEFTGQSSSSLHSLPC